LHYNADKGTRQERTFIAVKPDGVQRAIVGEIIKRFEQKGYKLVGLKLVHVTKEFAEVLFFSCSLVLTLKQKHYSDLSSKPFFP
jgi:nucleoside-diphosphate kinase